MLFQKPAGDKDHCFGTIQKCVRIEIGELIRLRLGRSCKPERRQGNRECSEAPHVASIGRSRKKARGGTSAYSARSFVRKSETPSKWFSGIMLHIRLLFTHTEFSILKTPRVLVIRTTRAARRKPTTLWRRVQLIRTHGQFLNAPAPPKAKEVPLSGRITLT